MTLRRVQGKALSLLGLEVWRRGKAPSLQWLGSPDLKKTSSLQLYTLAIAKSKPLAIASQA
jgi:hypothetical protein